MRWRQRASPGPGAWPLVFCAAFIVATRGFPSGAPDCSGVPEHGAALWAGDGGFAVRVRRVGDSSTALSIEPGEAYDGEVAPLARCGMRVVLVSCHLCVWFVCLCVCVYVFALVLGGVAQRLVPCVEQLLSAGRTGSLDSFLLHLMMPVQLWGA